MYLFSTRNPKRPKQTRQRFLATETLEPRRVLSAVPFGATVDDTAEFMLGSVVVSLVLFESDGSLDTSLEDWTSEQLSSVKRKVDEGLDWWTDRLDELDSVHSLNFIVDYTFADAPIQTGYEPINRPSNDFQFWVEDFFSEVGLESGGFNDRIRQFNHDQRIKHGTNWAFTIFIVNADADADNQFDESGDFSLSFAYAGGRGFVTTSERTASTIAHETAHMFWAMDEYAGGKLYTDTRGYYNTQNLNAFTGHPNPSERVRSILDRQIVAYQSGAISTSGMESIGWKDSDGDGIFDVLDVPLSLDGVGQFDAATRTYAFNGTASVNTLPNRNSSGTGNDITLNKISRIEYRLDDGNWQTVQAYDQYNVDVEFAIELPVDVRSIEFRAVDAASGVTSATHRKEIDLSPIGWQNTPSPLDVNADGELTPIDALMIINELNLVGARELPETRIEHGPPFIDVTGDGFVAPIDALTIINELNKSIGINLHLAAVSVLSRETSSTLDVGIEQDSRPLSPIQPLSPIHSKVFVAEGEIAARIAFQSVQSSSRKLIDATSRQQTGEQKEATRRKRFELVHTTSDGSFPSALQISARNIQTLRSRSPAVIDQAFEAKIF